VAEGGVEGASLLRVCVEGDRVVGARVVGSGVGEAGVAGLELRKRPC
jgi:hypothetical protein